MNDSIQRGPVTGRGRPQLPSLNVDHLLWFDGDHFGSELLGLITLGWRFEDALDSDLWSSRFSDFKFGDERSACAGRALLAYALRGIGWERLDGRVGVVSAISSSADRVDPASHTGSLGMHIARELGFQWRGEVLRKHPSPQAREISRRSDRIAAIRGTHYCVATPDCDLVILCDDLVTTGTTMTDIARAIHTKSPGTQVLGVALARNERLRFAASRGIVLSNDHIPVSWSNLWDRYTRTRGLARTGP